MVKEKCVGALKPGNPFRDWLVHKLEDVIEDDRCTVRVYRLPQASHNVCRYKFDGQKYSVVSKFYAEPTGWKKNYNYARAMEKEYSVLKKVSRVIDTPRPIAASRKFSCALVTEYIGGRSLSRCLRSDDGIYDNLTLVARTLRKLHDETGTEYRKDSEFSRFHKILDNAKLDHASRKNFNNLLGRWWYSSWLDADHGCRIHNDSNLANYIFRQDKVYALDFESSWKHAHPVHDLGIMAAELKYHFYRKKRDGRKAEPYIGHLLWHYSSSEAEFKSNTQALPLFMAMGLMRMARLNLGGRHRDYIIREALACLKANNNGGRK